VAAIGVMSITAGIVGAIAALLALKVYRSRSGSEADSTRRIITAIAVVVAIGFVGMATVGVVQIGIAS
jgi:heme A synthase